MKRSRKSLQNFSKAAEIGALTPLIMFGRLKRSAGGSPAAAWMDWNSWALEKAFAWQRMMSTAFLQSLQLKDGALVAARALAPLHRQVKRNARRESRRAR
jgi:hypothetical protein